MNTSHPRHLDQRQTSGATDLLDGCGTAFKGQSVPGVPLRVDGQGHKPACRVDLGIIHCQHRELNLQLKNH